MENISKAAVEELLKGHEFAKQLRQVVIDNNNGDGNVEDLVGKVIRSLTNTLLLLNHNKSEQSEELLSPMQQVKDPSFWNIHPTKSEDSQESCKSSIIKDRRGCYKRRRSSQTLEKESETLTDDGRGWRKYGQKMILNSKFPRNYYRCTHKIDQGCPATKQVQRIQEDPPLYRTTYYDIHTCRNLLNPEIILDSDSHSDPAAVFLSFDNAMQTKQDLIPAFFSSIKKDQCKEEIVNAEYHMEHHQNQSSITSDDYLLSPELTFDSSRHATLSDHHRDVMMSGVFCDSDDLDFFQSYLQFS